MATYEIFFHLSVSAVRRKVRGRWGGEGRRRHVLWQSPQEACAEDQRQRDKKRAQTKPLRALLAKARATPQERSAGLNEDQSRNAAQTTLVYLREECGGLLLRPKACPGHH